jgi:hypothetical protein
MSKRRPATRPRQPRVEAAPTDDGASLVPRPSEPRVPKVRRRRSQDQPPAPDGPPQEFMSVLKSFEQQVGEHVISVLQQEGTVAVMSTVLPAPDGTQRIVSIGLDARRMEEVQRLLAESDTEAAPPVPCVGFHCYLPGGGRAEGRQE